MAVNVYTLSIFIAVGFLLVVVELVRKNRLQERYSLLWIFMGVVLLVLAAVPKLIDILAAWLDIKNPPSLLFMLGLVYLIIYNLHLTTVVSRQSERITRLTQEIALLKHRGENEALNTKDDGSGKI